MEQITFGAGGRLEYLRVLAVLREYILRVLVVFLGSVLRILPVLPSISVLGTASTACTRFCTAHTPSTHSQYLGLQYCSYSQYSLAVFRPPVLQYSVLTVQNVLDTPEYRYEMHTWEHRWKVPLVGSRTREIGILRSIIVPLVALHIISSTVK